MAIDQKYFYIDADKPAPLYSQIQENIADLIELGILEPGELLPSERELSRLYDVNRLTVRQAIDRLVVDGLVRKQQGVGTFVEEQPAEPLALSVTGFSERMQSAGLKPNSRVISQTITMPSPTVAHRLGLRLGERVGCLKRLRMANEEPLMLEVCYLPLKRFPNLFDHDFEAHSLYHVLEHHYDVQVAEAEHTLEPTVLKQEEAESFKLRVGKPAMLVWVTAYDARREPIEFCQSLVRGDRCQFYFQVTTQRPIVS